MPHKSFMHHDSQKNVHLFFPIFGIFQLLENFKILQLHSGPIKGNQKMAFFGFEIWKRENISVGQKLGIENASFETQ